MRERMIYYKMVSIPKKSDCVGYASVALFLWNRKYNITTEEAQKAHKEHMQYDPEQGSCVKQILLFSKDYMEKNGFNLKSFVQFSDDNKDSFSGYYFMYFNFSDLSNHVEAVQVDHASMGNGSECMVLKNTRGEPEMTITKFIDRAKEDLTKYKEECKRVLLFEFQLNK